MAESAKKAKSISRTNSITPNPEKALENVNNNLEECAEYEDEGFDDEVVPIEVRVRFEVR